MWMLASVLIVSMVTTLAFAQTGSPPGSLAGDEVNARLRQKIKMGDFILRSPGMRQRLQVSDDKLAKGLLDRATENFIKMDQHYEQQEYLEAEAILDYVLRDLSAASQLLSADSRKQSRYKQSLQQFDSFELPQWKNLTLEQLEYLQTRLLQVGDLRAKALQLSSSQDYDAAVEVLGEAINLKKELLIELPHEQMIVYDLVFDSIQEEYKYLNQRSYHYLELVEIALARTEIELQTRKLVDKYIYRSLTDLEAAENLEYQGKFGEAIDMLDETIKQLISVLKLLGVKI